MADFTRYFNAVRFLEGLSNVRGKDYMNDRKNPGVYLKRMRYFLDLLGKPERGMQFVHITGTAGKGSVSNMVHAMLGASGRRAGLPRRNSQVKAGLFTSPFSTTSIEKIKVGGTYISPDAFADIVENMKPAIDEAYAKGPYGGPSYFEIFLAMALVYFKRERCTWAVLEVGCGGRYDATNVIRNPRVTAITNIDYDHTHILGKTLKKIAWDKAGIVKPGARFFTTETRPHLLEIFKRICAEKSVRGEFLGVRGLSAQEKNAVLARSIGSALGLSDSAIEKGIASARMPCRFELMQKGPAVILDGAHSPVKMRSTAEQASALAYRKLILVVAIADNKDTSETLEAIIPLADTIIFTRFENERKCADPKRLAGESAPFRKKSAGIAFRYDPLQALQKAMKEAGKDDLILVTGSFFLAGELRKKWYPEEWVLKHRRSK